MGRVSSNGRVDLRDVNVHTMVIIRVTADRQPVSVCIFFIPIYKKFKISELGDI